MRLVIGAAHRGGAGAGIAGITGCAVDAHVGCTVIVTGRQDVQQKEKTAHAEDGMA